MFPDAGLFFRRRQPIRLAVVILLLLMGLGTVNQSLLLAQDSGGSTCSALVEQAIQMVDAGCATGVRNQACYGHGSIEAEMRAEATETFAVPGDQAALKNLVRIATTPLNLDTSEWGIALLTVQANLPDTLPGQNVTFLLLGDAEVTDASAEGAEAGAMQAFYFKNGLNPTFECKEAPYGALALQNPQGTKVTLNINGLDVSLGSTAVVFAQPNDQMQFLTVAGEATLTAAGVTQVVPGGQMSTIPLGGDNGLAASGPPSDPQPFPAALVENIPFELLPEAVTLPAGETTSGIRPLLLNLEYTAETDVPGGTGLCAPDAPIDVVLAFDMSKLMRGVPVALLKDASAHFMEQLDPATDRAAVVYFSSDMDGFPEGVKVLYPLGNNFSEAETRIETLTGLCSTNLHLGLVTSHELLTDSGRKDACQAIVLVSDGVPNVEAQEATLLRALADEIEADGIHLLTVALSGTAEGMFVVDTDPENMALIDNGLPYLPMSAVDRDMLTGLSDAPADFVYVPMPGELSNALVHLARRLTSPQAERDLVFTYTLNRDAYELIPGSTAGGVITGNTIQWQLPALSAGEPVVLPFAVRPLKTGREAVGSGEVSCVKADGATVTDALLSRMAPPPADLVFKYGENDLLTIGATATGTLTSYDSHRWMIDTPANQLFSVTVEGAASQYPPQLVDGQFQPIFPLYWLTTETGTTSVFYAAEAGAKWLYLASTEQKYAGTYTLHLLDGAVDEPVTTLAAGSEPFTDQQNRFAGRTYALDGAEGDTLTVKAFTDSFYGDYTIGPVLVYAVSLSDGQWAEKLPFDASLDSRAKQEGDVFNVMKLRGAGPYRLVAVNQIYDLSAPESLDYTLEVSADDATRSDEGVLAVGQTITGTGADAQTLHYTLEDVPGNVFSLDVKYDMNSGAFVQVEVTDFQQNWVDCESHFTDEGEVYVCSPFVGVPPYQLAITPSGGGEYSLTLTEGNALSAATADTPALNIGDSIEVTEERPEYAYKLDVQEGETITVHVSVPWATLQLESADGWPATFIPSTENETETIQTIELTGAGPYLLTIYDIYPPFTISVEVGEAGAVENPVGEYTEPEAIDAGEIQFCQQVTVEPVSTPFGYVRYHFEAEPGQIVTVYSKGGGIATVYDADANPLGSGGEVIDFDEAYNMYTLYIYVLSGTGPYTLEFLTSSETPAYEAAVLEGAVEKIPKGGPECLTSAGESGGAGGTVDVSGGVLIKVTAASANLRGGAGKNFDVVGTAAAGDQLTVVGRNSAGDWYKVARTDGSDAWIFSQLVTPVDASTDLSALPVIP